jgi:hypothetical protein
LGGLNARRWDELRDETKNEAGVANHRAGAGGCSGSVGDAGACPGDLLADFPARQASVTVT